MKSGRRMWTAALAVVAVVLVLVAVDVALRIASPGQRAAQAAPPSPRPVTASLENRRLDQKLTQTVTVVAGHSYDLKTPTDLASEDSVVTSVGVRSGDEIRDGTYLMDISGQPLIAAQLPFPLWRDISIGVKGPDVAAVGAFLRRQGVSNRDWSADTPADQDMQRSVDRLLTRFGYSGSEGPPASPSTASSTSTGDPTPSTPLLPRRWLLAVDGDHRITTVRIAVGTVLTSPDVLLFSCDTTVPTFMARFDQAAAALIHQGTTGLITNQSNNSSSTATVVTVASTVSTDANTGVSGYLVIFVVPSISSITTAVGQLIVTVDASASTQPVLSAPVSAIYTDLDGGSHIVPVRDGRIGDRVGVTVGACVDGWCQVSTDDASIKAGTTVLVGYNR